jgi:hypothetical protein
VGHTGRHTVNRTRKDRHDAGSLYESNVITINHNNEAIRQACTRLAQHGSCQLVQQGPGLLEISRRKSLGKPAIHRGEQVRGFLGLALLPL